MITILCNLLKREGALTSDECWSKAQSEGLKSKTHMKQILKYLRKNGLVHTRPDESKGKPFVYELTPKKLQRMAKFAEKQSS